MTSPDSNPETPIEDLTYGEALIALEDLLDELESSDVDVDRLTEQVARGVQLVRFCRSRLEIVTGEVDGVVADLVAADDAHADDPPADDPPAGHTASDDGAEGEAEPA